MLAQCKPNLVLFSPEQQIARACVLTVRCTVVVRRQGGRGEGRWAAAAPRGPARAGAHLVLLLLKSTAQYSLQSSMVHAKAHRVNLRVARVRDETLRQTLRLYSRRP